MKTDSKQWKKIVVDGAYQLGIDVSDEQVDRFGIHARELLNWNRTTNLTAITGSLDVAVKHFVDAIAVTPLIRSGSSVLDIGSGGGFPGLIIAVMDPSNLITLIEASRKKVSFLKYIVRTMGLSHVNVHHVRAEDLARDPVYQNHFDLVVCRAFSSLDKFVKIALPFLAPKGIAIAMKGKPDALVSDRISKEGIKISVTNYKLPVINAQRCIYRISPSVKG